MGNIDEHKSIARRFLQAWSAGGQSVIDELAHPDLVVQYSHFDNPVRGVDQFKKMLELTHQSFPDMHVEAGELIAEGDRVVVRWTYSATHQVEVYGLPPTGRALRVHGITVYRLAQGRVVEESGVMDNLSLMEQLGVVQVR